MTSSEAKGVQPEGLKEDPGIIGKDFKIPGVSLMRSLRGILVAAKLSADEAAPFLPWFMAREEPDGLSFSGWQEVIALSLEGESRLKGHIARLSLVIAFLRESCRHNIPVSSTELSFAWEVIYSILTDTTPDRPLFSATQSAQGFIAVPLCSLIKEDGTIDELFRFHVWMPNRPPGNTDLAIHSHQPFAQSWILAGEGTDVSYDVEATTDTEVATHAEYALAWDDGKNVDTKYKTHQAYSIVKNTGRLVRASLAATKVHSKDMSYSIPAGAYHISEVKAEILHSTIFFFDSHRGFIKDAPILGPKGAESFKHRKPSPAAASSFAKAVELVRSWESWMEQGREHSQNANWEHSLQAFDKALKLCDAEYFPNAARYRQSVYGELGCTNRRFGRYSIARDYLEDALAGMKPSMESVEISGELGVVYRQMGRLDDARRAFTMQYDDAKELNAERAMCRAIGNLGMVNYQLSLQQDPPNAKLLDLAIENLLERVKRARELRESISNQQLDAKTQDRWLRVATTWASIGLDRLSLVYTARGDTKKAINACLESQSLTHGSSDSTVTAFSRFFLGRALYRDGQHDVAMEQLNQAKPCSPAIALCKEPSDEHRGYLQDLVDAGVDMDLIDEHGYTALDYAVFNGDKETEAVVLAGLRNELGADADKKLAELSTGSKLRKAYRELFQEKLRPVLLDNKSDDKIQALRREYAECLAQDEEKSQIFDGLKYIRYADFCDFGKLPSWTDGILHEYKDEGREVDFVIFFSYRWINKKPGATSPDDDNHTQYGRMKAAAEEFLKLHPNVDQKKLGIWVDFACVRQDDPMPGVSALPMILMQCNAVICLIDEQFHERAWCAVEVMMVQAIKKAYSLHLWYEQRPNQAEGEKWALQEGPVDLDIRMKDKLLTFEDDRPKVLFLERQSKLLG
ncbi:Fc.00g092770.m01.CDS01 [Cosmosporella sp. VM-42]